MLEGEIDREPVPPPLLHPNLAEIYRRKVAQLEQALQDPAMRDEAFAVLRGLIDQIEVHPTEDGFDIDFRGQIANMISLPGHSDDRSVDHFVISAKRVAGARNHRELTLPPMVI